MSQTNYSSNRGPGFLTGILFILMGGMVAGIGFGLIPADPSRVHAPGWLLAVFGGTFVVAGVWVIFQRAVSQDTAAAGWINFLFALLVMFSLSVICLWIGFGPGQRLFVSKDSLTGMRTSLTTDPIFGRIFIGCFGVLMTVVTIAIAIIQGRKLLGWRNDH